MNEFLSSSHPAIVAGTLRACKKGEREELEEGGAGRNGGWGLEARSAKPAIAAEQLQLNSLQASQNQFTAVETRGVPTPDINIGSDISPGGAETNPPASLKRPTQQLELPQDDKRLLAKRGKDGKCCNEENVADASMSKQRPVITYSGQLFSSKVCVGFTC